MFPRNPFLLYNNLPGFSLLKALLFADETTLFASADTLEELIYTRICKFRIPKSCVIFQRTWNGFPPSKTKCMLFNCSEHQIAIANANIFISYFKSVRVRTRRDLPESVYASPDFLHKLSRGISLESFGGFIVFLFLFRLRLFLWY